MSEYSIEVSPSSKVVVFQGNLKKAPNLNRRGRKVRHNYDCLYSREIMPPV